MFENFPPSKSQLIPDFPVLPLMKFAEMNQEEILCIVRRVNNENCAHDSFNTRKKSSEIISDPITTIFTYIVNSSFSTGVFPDSEKICCSKAFNESWKR